MKTQPTSRAESQQLTRDALLRAGAQVIAQNGYAGASVRDIAARAGFTQGAFYSNFQSKDDLVFAIMRAMFQEAYDGLTALAAHPDIPAKDLVAQATRWLDGICASGEKSLLDSEISLHALRDPDFATTYFALLNEHALQMAGVLEDIARARKLVLCAPALQLANGMIAMARGLKQQVPHQEAGYVADTLHVFLEAAMTAPQNNV